MHPNCKAFCCILAALLLHVSLAGLAVAAEGPSIRAVVTTYADIAHAAYEDSLSTAKRLGDAIAKLSSAPDDRTLGEARAAWIAARVPYQQTEAYRFGNAIVDDWEGRVNAWPLDEGLIDYVAGDYGAESDENALYVANVIASRSLQIDGRTVDASRISKELLAGLLNEAGGVEANVATGYHALEFLLWGQDLNGTGPGAGRRPPTDFDVESCTGGNCERRARYLRVAADLLIDDLTWMVAQWAPDGAARAQLLAMPEPEALATVFKGLGSLSYGELAGERMKLGLLIHDPEEEHDCFSDNTHSSHHNNALGIRNVYLGVYRRVDGRVVSGPSVSDVVRSKSPEADKRLRAALDETMKRMRAIVERAKTVEAYDQMIAEGNAEGNAVIQAAIDALLVQTKEIERAVAALELARVAVEGSDSLDAPGKVR